MFCSLWAAAFSLFPKHGRSNKHFKRTKKINKEIKTLFVGGHVAALPKETLENETSIDFVALNEGVYAISNLLKVEDLNDEIYLKKVKGIGFRNKEKIFINEPQSIVPKNF